MIAFGNEEAYKNAFFSPMRKSPSSRQSILTHSVIWFMLCYISKILASWIAKINKALAEYLTAIILDVKHEKVFWNNQMFFFSYYIRNF